MGTAGVLVFVIIVVVAGVLAIANQRRAALVAGWVAVGVLAAVALYFGIGWLVLLITGG